MLNDANNKGIKKKKFSFIVTKSVREKINNKICKAIMNSKIKQGELLLLFNI